ncbi:Acb2/Tad1 domain-containing protein [Streptomyces cadmiisoli]|uniref:Acb2/Tad1 domain-containing protein n=1 Tax=Streptomyces cadmiisoli TaxID=2184053 RepID=UPI003668D4E6
MAISRREIGIRFAPPKTDETRNDVKAQISTKAEELALLIHDLVPGCREESQAIKGIEIAVQWAHDAVDRRLVLPGEHAGAPDIPTSDGGPALAGKDV